MANITKRGSSYTITVSMGKDGTGKRIRKSLTYSPPPSLTPKQAEKEAQRQAAMFEERCRTGQVLDTNTRFSDFVEIWLRDYAEKQLEPRTLTRYKELLRRINAAFGNSKINAIQPHHLTEFYNNLSEKGIRADIKYKPTDKAAELVDGKDLTRAELSRLAGLQLRAAACRLPLNDIQLPRGRRLRLLPSLFVCSGRARQREYKKAAMCNPEGRNTSPLYLTVFSPSANKLPTNRRFLQIYRKSKNPLNGLFKGFCIGCGGRTRTYDLRVMRTSSH